MGVNWDLKISLLTRAVSYKGLAYRDKRLYLFISKLNQLKYTKHSFGFFKRTGTAIQKDPENSIHPLMEQGILQKHRLRKTGRQGL